MTNIPFILGQIGLALAAISGIGIIHNRAAAFDRPAWYYFVSVWCVSVASALLFSQPYVYSFHQFMPPIAYYFRLVFGLERTLVFINYQWGMRGRQLPTAWILRINTALGSFSVLIMVGVFGWAMYGAVLENRMEFRRLRSEIRENKKTVGVDTAQVGIMQRKIDTLTAQLSLSRQNTARLEGQLGRANQKLESLVDVVISLKNAINRLGISVERTRTSISMPSASLPPLPPSGEIPTSKVKPPQPVRYDKKGRKLSSTEAKKSDVSDSLLAKNQ